MSPSSLYHQFFPFPLPNAVISLVSIYPLFTLLLSPQGGPSALLTTKRLRCYLLLTSPNPLPPPSFESTPVSVTPETTLVKATNVLIWLNPMDTSWSSPCLTHHAFIRVGSSLPVGHVLTRLLGPQPHGASRLLQAVPSQSVLLGFLRFPDTRSTKENTRVKSLELSSAHHYSSSSWFSV